MFCCVSCGSVLVGKIVSGQFCSKRCSKVSIYRKVV